VVAGGLAALPAAAFAQDPAAADPVAPPAPQAAPAETAAVPAETAACAPRDREDTLAQEDQAAPAAPPVEALPATSAEDPEHPVANCSQNAGDNQYQDPFANSPPPGGDGAGSSQTPDSGSSDGSGTVTPTVQQDGTVLASPSDATAAAGPSLPNTGLGLGGLVVLGLPLLAGGIALRARLA
jgi:hypothetical protein